MQLHPQLQRDCRLLGHLPLCQVLLMDDASYPWFILVPAREGVTEIFQLATDEQRQLISESSLFSRALYHAFAADKLNIATLGNRVPQLHIHHIVRYRDDPAWPGPVWGHQPPRPYSDAARDEVISRLGGALSGSAFTPVAS